MTDVTIMVPGILGSVLVQPDGSDLWSDNFLGNYWRLIRNPGQFAFHGERAGAPRILDAIRLPTGLRLRSLFNRVRDEAAADASRRNGLVVDYPYDWRADLIESAELLAAELRNRFGTNLMGSNLNIRAVTHSMGGLLVRIAVGAGFLPPASIQRVIHIGSPLGGSAAAVRSLFDSFRLPLIEPFFYVAWGRGMPLAKQNVRDVMATFPSIYQLIPPQRDRFLMVATGVMVNPLDSGEYVIPADKKGLADRAHEAIRRSHELIPKAKVRIVRGFGLNTDAEYKVYRDGSRYELLPPLPLRESSGDGTVTAASAADGGDYAVANVQAVQHAFMCNDSRVAVNVRNMFDAAP